MLQIKETHQRIIDIIERRGPSLPIQISKEMQMSSLFISAFLSELADEKRVKVSNLKVGGSPLYFLEGQEEQLNQFSKFLHPKEAEALKLLKQKKILKDSEQEPAIRVALRSIRDFASGFKKDNEIYWKNILMPEQEVREILEPEQKPKEKEIPKIKVIQEEKETQKKHIPKQDNLYPKEKIKIEENTVKFENPLITKEIVIQKKEKEKPKFVLEIIDSIEKLGFKIVEEREFKAKEYNALIEIQSDLGPITFLSQAKDKKSISEVDLSKLLSNAQKIPLPALMIYKGDLNKKAKEYTEKYSSILKTKKLE